MSPDPASHTLTRDQFVDIFLGAVVVFGAILAVATVLLGSDQEGPLWASAITASALLLAGLLAVHTTDARQVRQLEAAQRQLETQLAHARGLADVADLRDVLQHGLKARDEVMAAAADPGKHRDARQSLRAANNRLRLRGDLVPQAEWKALFEALQKPVDKKNPVSLDKAGYDKIEELVESYVAEAIESVKALTKTTESP